MNNRINNIIAVLTCMIVLLVASTTNTVVMATTQVNKNCTLPNECLMKLT